MPNRTTIAAKAIVISWALLIPYFIWILTKSVHHTLPPYPWPGVIGLVYISTAIGVVIAITKRMFRAAMEEESLSSGDLGSLDGSATLERVYVSSIKHLELFQALPWYAKYLGFLPRGFPRLRTFFLSYPTVYFAAGQLRINSNHLTVSASMLSYDAEGPYGDIGPEIRMTITPDQVVAVQRLDVRQIVMAAIPLSFIRIRVDVGALNDFLVCSGSENLSTMKRETELLWNSLSAFEHGKSLRVTDGASSL